MPVQLQKHTKMNECSGYYWNVAQDAPSRNCRDLFVAFAKVMEQRGSWGKGRASRRRMEPCLNTFSEDDLLIPKVFGENVSDQRRAARNHFNRAIRHAVDSFKVQLTHGTQKDPILGDMINYVLWIFPMIRATPENRKTIGKRIGSFISNRIGQWKRSQTNYRKGPCKKKGQKRTRRDAPLPPTAIEEDLLVDDDVGIACGDMVKLKDAYSDRIIGEGVLLLPVAVHPDFQEWEVNRYALICLRKKSIKEDVFMPWSGDQPWDECRIGCNIMWERVSLLSTKTKENNMDNYEVVEMELDGSDDEGKAQSDGEEAGSRKDEDEEGEYGSNGEEEAESIRGEDDEENEGSDWEEGKSARRDDEGEDKSDGDDVESERDGDKGVAGSEEGVESGEGKRERRFASGGGWCYEEIDSEEEREKEPKEMGKGKRARKARTYFVL